MCGIVYAHNFKGKPVNNYILDQYDSQRSRGQQGFGIYDGEHGHLVHAAKEDRILNWLCKYDSSLLLMHHRYPTSTVNVRKTAHPFTTKDYFGDTQYILIHNGVMSNEDELFVKHQMLDIEYQSLLEDLSFNDSEALLWDFALYMEGKQPKMESIGAMAFICLKKVKGKLEKMYFARNSNPLKMHRSEIGISLSSEGAGEMIDANTLYTWHYGSKRLTKRPLVLQTYKFEYSGDYTSGKYEYDGYDSGYTNRHYGQQKLLNDENEYNYWGNRPTIIEEEAEYMVSDYLDEAGGDKEMAYWLAEADYDSLNEDNDNESFLELTIIEKAMEILSLT